MNWLINFGNRVCLSVGLLLWTVLCIPTVFVCIIIHLPVWIVTGLHTTVIALDIVDVMGDWVIDNFGG